MGSIIKTITADNNITLNEARRLIQEFGKDGFSPEELEKMQGIIDSDSYTFVNPSGNEFFFFADDKPRRITSRTLLMYATNNPDIFSPRARITLNELKESKLSARINESSPIRLATVEFIIEIAASENHKKGLYIEIRYAGNGIGGGPKVQPTIEEVLRDGKTVHLTSADKLALASFLFMRSGTVVVGKASGGKGVEIEVPYPNIADAIARAAKRENDSEWHPIDSHKMVMNEANVVSPEEHGRHYYEKILLELIVDMRAGENATEEDWNKIRQHAKRGGVEDIEAIISRVKKTISLERYVLTVKTGFDHAFNIDSSLGDIAARVASFKASFKEQGGDPELIPSVEDVVADIYYGEIEIVPEGSSLNPILSTGLPGSRELKAATKYLSQILLYGEKISYVGLVKAGVELSNSLIKSFEYMFDNYELNHKAVSQIDIALRAMKRARVPFTKEWKAVLPDFIDKIDGQMFFNPGDGNLLDRLDKLKSFLQGELQKLSK